MADLEIGNPHGVQEVDGDNSSGALDNDNLDTIALMKTRLQTVDSGWYTDARLNAMTYNDLVYACRVEDGNGIN